MHKVKDCFLIKLQAGLLKKCKTKSGLKNKNIIALTISH